MLLTRNSGCKGSILKLKKLTFSVFFCFLTFFRILLLDKL